MSGQPWDGASATAQNKRFAAHRLWRIALAFLCLQPGALLAQSGEEMPVPRPGIWSHSCLFEWSKQLSGVDRPVALDMIRSEDFELWVSPCVDRIELRHPQAVIEMPFTNGEYFGTVSQGGQDITVRLKPVSRTRLIGSWVGKLGNKKVGWEMQCRDTAPAAQGPNAGAGDLTYVVEATEREGLWKHETRDYTVAVWDFDVNDSTLLPLHQQTLDDAIGILGAESTSCVKVELERFSDIVGFASQTGPETINQRLASARARRVEDYLAENGREAFERAGLEEHLPWHGMNRRGRRAEEPLPRLDLPGVESECSRAAAFTFRLRTSTVEIYTPTELEEWLEAELRQACELPENQQSAPRRRAKAKFWLGMNLLEMVEQDRCEPAFPDHRVAHKFLQDAHQPGAALEAAYQEAARDQPYLTGAAATAAGSQRLRAEHQWRMNLDPYYRYTWQENPGATRVRDRIEREVCGDVLPMETWNRSPSPGDLFEAVLP